MVWTILFFKHFYLLLLKGHHPFLSIEFFLRWPLGWGLYVFLQPPPKKQKKNLPCNSANSVYKQQSFVFVAELTELQLDHASHMV